MTCRSDGSLTDFVNDWCIKTDDYLHWMVHWQILSMIDAHLYNLFPTSTTYIIYFQRRFDLHHLYNNNVGVLYNMIALIVILVNIFKWDVMYVISKYVLYNIYWWMWFYVFKYIYVTDLMFDGMMLVYS